MQITGAQMLVKALRAEGVTELFAYPGGSAIDMFNALYGCKDIEVLLPRHEQALVHEADGYARSTGKTGVCLVTSGPGATNLVTGIATANFDSVPMVLITGQVPTSLIGNDAFQEVDIVGIVRNICKYAVTVHDRAQLNETLRKAFYIASTGKPGPVLVDIPKDIQNALGSDEYPDKVSIRGYKPNEKVHMGQLKKALQALEGSYKPLLLLGGGVNVARCQEQMTAAVDLLQVPVVTTVMGKGAVPTDHPLYMGNIGMHGSYAANHAISECDLLFTIGCRFSDRITGKADRFASNAKIVHVDIDPASISRNIVVDIPIVADAKRFVEALLETAKQMHVEDWIARLDSWRTEYKISMRRETELTPEQIIKAVNRLYPEFIMTTDVGQNQMWASQWVELNNQRQFLTSGGLGTMGFGLPSAIGAQIGNPDANVVCITGDGGMQMNIQELASARLWETPVTVIILNNQYLGNVRQWQEMFYDRHYALTCLRMDRHCPPDCTGPNLACPPMYVPDFVRLAESYDCKAKRISSLAELEPALLEAKAERRRPTILECIISREDNIFPMVPGGYALDEMIME